MHAHIHNMDKAWTSGFVKDHQESKGRVYFEVFEKLTRACFTQIVSETVLLLIIVINNTQENVQDNLGAWSL